MSDQNQNANANADDAKTFDFADFNPANYTPLPKPDYTQDDVNLDLPRGWCYLDSV